jgi:hypothetical protein
LQNKGIKAIAHISLPIRIIEEIIRTRNKALDADNNKDKRLSPPQQIEYNLVKKHPPTFQYNLSLVGPY